MDDQSESSARSASGLEDIRARVLAAESVKEELDGEGGDVFGHRGIGFGTAGAVKYEFIAVLSHELRNSLGVLRNAASVLRRELSPPPAVVQARLLIERQVGQMTRLVEDLLEAARIRGGALHLRRARIDLRAVLWHSLQTVDCEVQQRALHTSVSMPDSALWVHADATRLEQVFVNLLGNATKYTASGGHIDLSLVREGTEAVVRIRDDGVGIAAELLPRVFDLFVQSDAAATRSDAGLGIGLALVRSLVASHGGEVSAASAGVGRGSELTVRLPLVAQSR